MRAFVLLLLAVALAGCSVDQDPSGTPDPAAETRQPSMAVPSSTAKPVTTVAPSPSATPDPTTAPSAGPTTPPARPASLEWTRLGKIVTGSGGSILGVRRIAGGYVAWGTYGKGDDDPPFTTWFSPDGRAWERTVHAESIVPCPGWTARPDLESVYEPATDGRTLVFAATLLLPDAAACDRVWMVSLSTRDGRTWSRSEPFGTPHDAAWWAMWSEMSWATPDGWETLVSNSGPEAEIWRTTDLEAWARVASQPADLETGLDFELLAAAPDGTRLGLSTEGTDETTRAALVASSDAIEWRRVRTLPAGFGVTGVVPPAAPGRPWLVAIQRDEQEEARILVSTDLVDWAQVTMRKPGVAALADVEAGWVAVGFWPQRDTGCGDSCRRPRPSLYTSADGLTWVNHPDSMPPGEAQVLAGVGNGEVLAAGEPANGRVTMWRLAGGS